VRLALLLASLAAQAPGFAWDVEALNGLAGTTSHLNIHKFIAEELP